MMAGGAGSDPSPRFVPELGVTLRYDPSGTAAVRVQPRW